MTATNVDLVRAFFAAWERGDFSSLEWAHSEIEWVNADGPSPGTWTGVAGIVEGWRDFLSTWKDYRGKAEEYRELDDERVLVLITGSGRGKTSGMELGHLSAQWVDVFHVRDGKVTKVMHYFDRERGFADLGLAPEADSPAS